MKAGTRIHISRFVAIVFFLVLTFGLAGMAHAFQKEVAAKGPLLDRTFEAEGSWMSFGTGGQVRLTPDAAREKSGKPALAFDYKIEPKQFAAAVLPVTGGALAEMKLLKFWIKTDSATAIAVILSEKKPEGGNYNAIFWSPKDTWHQVELTPDDFAPSDGPNDPRDPDGKLDLDQVEGVGIIDLGQFLSTLAEKPDFPIMVDPRSGSHTFYVDDFVALAEAPSAPPSPDAQAVTIDDFHRPSLSWLTLGGAELSLSTGGSPVAGRALEAQYFQSEGRFVLITHAVGRLDLRNAVRLDFDIASVKDARLILSLEKRRAGASQGPRYTTTLDVPGNSKPVHQSISFADLTLDENGPADPDGKLNPDQIKSISLTDITGAFSHEQQQNTIWIAQMRAQTQAGGKTGQTPQFTSPKAEASDMGGMVMNDDDHSHVTETMSHHMHMGPHMKMTELRQENVEDAKRADEIVMALRSAIEKYRDYRVAEKDGFQPYMPNLRLPEYHFTNYKYGLRAAYQFDPAYPTSLLYKKTSDGYQLVGAMYTAPERATEDALDARVPLSVARWHLHVNICEPPGGMTEEASWLKFGPAGSISTEADCSAAGGKFLPHMFGWMVHVYPFEKAPENIWAH